MPELKYTNCGGVFTTLSGSIEPALSNSDYTTDLHCDYLIQVPKHLKINLTIKNFIENVSCDEKRIWVCFN